MDDHEDLLSDHIMKDLDCLVCGSCVVDLHCLTVPLDQPIGMGSAHPIEPITVSCGGLTCNTGVALQRLGVRTGVLTYVGKDYWGKHIRDTLAAEGVDTRSLRVHPNDPTTAVTVLVDPCGERSFLVPKVRTATKSIDAAFVLEQLEARGNPPYFVFGYFGRMPKLQPDLIELLPEIRRRGCQTVMETSDQGGDPALLGRLLPYLDIYIPSRQEAQRQTGLSDPVSMLDSYRDQGATGLLGIKLGDQGALLHDLEAGLIELPALHPPAPVVDTTGAGDCFLAGFLAGRHRGLPLAKAGKLATAAGAMAVTERGGSSGIPDFETLGRLFSIQ